MRQKLIWLLVVVAVFLVCLSAVYLWSHPHYELAKVEDIKTDETLIDVTYQREENVLKEDVLGILTIDKIGLKATVKEGSTSDVLQEYIGHISETAKYDGNIGLAAHNRLNKYSYFARINELEKGDTITYQTKFGTKEYRVEKKRVIFETDWSTLEDDGTNKLTLITCIAGKRNQRLCVQAVQQ